MGTTRKSAAPKPPSPSAAGHGAALKILKKDHFNPAVAVERQIAAHVRQLIHAKKLSEHMRLPPMRMLAELWGTNYFTVQAALGRLVHEGLIVKSQKIGSFVAPARRALRRVCLYHDRKLSSDWSYDFYSRLNVGLYRLLAECGIGVVPFFDQRPEKLLNTMPAELRDKAKDGEIDAVIATAIYPKNTGWLKRLQVPVASTMLNSPQSTMVSNVENFARLAVEEAVRCRRKTIGLIHVAPSQARASDPLLEALETLAAQHGIAVVLPAPVSLRKLHWEQTGFRLCEGLLQAKVRPDLLFVHPDTLIRGVVTALLQHRVSVPAEITLVSHRNAESPLYVPFPVTWLTVRIEDFALGLLEQIEQQVAGEQVKPFEIKVCVER